MPTTETPLERTISTEGAVELDQADVVAEADFHMAYGLYDQAAELLSRALRDSPDRRDLRLKLLEVYFIWENKAAFLKEAQIFQRQLKGAADPDWNKVVIMGKQICPGEALFAGAVGATGEVGLDLGTADDEGGYARGGGRARDQSGIQSYPPNAPITARPDWRGKDGRAATSVDQVTAQVLDRWGASHAILNCIYGVQLVLNEDMAVAFARALNTWIAKEWLDRDPRLQGIDRGAAAERRARGRRDRALGGRQALRSGAGAGDGRRRRSAGGSSGRSGPQPRSTACRSASTPARPIAIP